MLLALLALPALVACTTTKTEPSSTCSGDNSCGANEICANFDRAYYACAPQLTCIGAVGSAMTPLAAPATWSSAELACASSAGWSRIVSTPCDGLVALVAQGTDSSGTYLYDASGALVASIDFGLDGYTCGGDRTISAACVHALTADVTSGVRCGPSSDAGLDASTD
jgi:hypothetical protein